MGILLISALLAATDLRGGEINVIVFALTGNTGGFLRTSAHDLLHVDFAFGGITYTWCKVLD